MDDARRLDCLVSWLYLQPIQNYFIPFVQGVTRNFVFIVQRNIHVLSRFCLNITQQQHTNGRLAPLYITLAKATLYSNLLKLTFVCSVRAITKCVRQHKTYQVSLSLKLKFTQKYSDKLTRG